MSHFDNCSEYFGDLNEEGRRHGYGCQKWYNQKYCGSFVEDNLHGDGIYTSLKDKYMYEGSFYANCFEGYARIIQDDCTYFEGLHKKNDRFGPGVLTYPNGNQDVGLWLGQGLIRLSQTVCSHWVPKLAVSNPAKIQLLGYRKLVSVEPEQYKANLIIPIYDEPDMIYNDNIRNPNASAFNKPRYDREFFGDKSSYIEVALGENESSCSLVEEDEEEEDVGEPQEVQDVISLLLRHVERFLDSSNEELRLIELKKCFLEILPKVETPLKIKTKKMPVKNLLAWNNECISVELLKHSFVHRHNENTINFDVPKLLSGDRSVFGDPGILECACISFLNHCSNGNESEARTLATHCHINPDLSDSNGNTAVFFAACRDRWNIIRLLTNLGANLDAMNDENLTPLTLCLTRYIAYNKAIRNWEEAFLDAPKISEKDLEEINSWRPQRSLISLIAKEYVIKHSDGIYFGESEELILYILQGLQQRDADFEDIFQKLGLTEVSESLRNFQKPYQLDKGDDEEPFTTQYVFHTEFRKKVKAKKAKKAKKSKKQKNKKEPDIVIEEKLELDVIVNTIRVLLHFGADPNYGELPMPPLFLAVYSENPLILWEILEAGASPNLSYKSMTPLHIICNIPSATSLSEMAQVLFQYGADPNVRTAPDHWLEEGFNIMGKQEGDPAEGKTALHILAMRYDEIPDELLETLVRAGAKDLNYLGHTPLSLAVLRGNSNIADRLLKSGSDPNQILGNNLGIALTIYTLNRYNNTIPDIKTCLKITDILINSYANPLNQTGLHLNCIEFMRLEESSAPQKKEKKNTKKKKKKKKNVVDMYKEKLVKISREVALRHYQFKAHVENYKKVLFGDEENKNLLKFLNIDEALKMHQLLINRKIIDMREDLHALITYKLFQLYSTNGFKVKKKKKKYKLVDDLAKLELPEEDTEEPINVKRKRRKKHLAKQVIREFELDPNEEKYVVCFQCLLKKDKMLIVCPNCGLVYFCSEACNKANIRMKGTRHPCKGLFYAEQLKRYYELKALGLSLPKLGGNALLGLKKELKNLGDYLKDDLLKSLLGENGEFVNPFTTVQNKDTATGKRKGKKASGRDRSGRSKSTSSYGREKSSRGSSSGRSRSSGMDSKKKGRRSDDSYDTSRRSRSRKSGKSTRDDDDDDDDEKGTRGKKNKRGKSKNRSDDDNGDGGQRSKKSKKVNKNRNDDERRSGRNGQNKRSKGRKGNDSDDYNDRRKGKRGKKGMKDISGRGDDGRREKGRSSSRKGDGDNELDENYKKSDAAQLNNDKTGTHTNDGDNDKLKQIVRLPNKYQLFMRKLAELFPDFDWSSFLLPFICFTDGQLYYRFASRPPIFCPTYTGI